MGRLGSTKTGLAATVPLVSNALRTSSWNVTGYRSRAWYRARAFASTKSPANPPPRTGASSWRPTYRADIERVHAGIPHDTPPVASHEELPGNCAVSPGRWASVY